MNHELLFILLFFHFSTWSVYLPFPFHSLSHLFIIVSVGISPLLLTRPPPVSPPTITPAHYGSEDLCLRSIAYRACGLCGTYVSLGKRANKRARLSVRVFTVICKCTRELCVCDCLRLGCRVGARLCWSQCWVIREGEWVKCACKLLRVKRLVDWLIGCCW